MTPSRVQSAVRQPPSTIVLAKLHWFRIGGEISELQWRDLESIVRLVGSTLDREYLEQSAPLLGVADLLQRLFNKP